MVRGQRPSVCLPVPPRLCYGPSKRTACAEKSISTGICLGFRNLREDWLMRTGGSRTGAGRPRQHARVEDCLSIDVQCWQREGRLTRSGSDQWSRAYLVCGTAISSLRYRVDDHAGALIIKLAYPIGERCVIERVRVDLMPCTFGGSRPWFRCAGCDRRVGKIYLRGGHFACRTCQQLVYASQSLDSIGRGWRMQQRLEAKIGKDLKRPLGMHARTYEQILARIRDSDARRKEQALTVALSVIARHDRRVRLSTL